ncbi:MAG: hypothetical protein Q8K86_10770 [Candidatus Nanopelagicaceae bacterium]|nr:hypothetical protein [Candidatus Nanopelagicaceae bacterium]
MKTKELIRQLQKEDPTGEEEVVIGNADIFYVDNVEAYWDGKAEQLIRDPNNHYYNVVGGKIRCKGNKVRIHAYSLEEAVNQNPDLPVDLSELSDYNRVAEEKIITKWREDARMLDWMVKHDQV